MRNIDEMFMFATQTLKDNRIPPRRTLHEKLGFKDVKVSQVSRVELNVYYETDPIPFLAGTKRKVLLASESFTLTTPKNTFFYVTLGFLVLLLILLISGVLIFRRR